MKLMQKIANLFVFMLTGKGKIAERAVDEGLIDYSGQGKNKYGK